MIDKRILRLTPEQFFCPFCGDWHDWEGKTLQSYDDVLNTYEYECGDTRIEFWSGRLYGERDYIGRNYIGREHSGRDFIGVIVSTRCTKVCNNSIPKCFLDEIEYDDDESVIKFSTTLSTTGEISSSGECEHCEHCDECNLPNIGDERDDDEDEDEFKLTLEFKFKFSKREEEELKQQQELERQREEELKQQQELERQREEELKQKQELERQREAEFKKQHAEEPCINKTTQIKEDSTMANNLFNMNMEFGPNKDNNIASTLMGIAVKNGESWRIYDKKKKEITDVGDMQFGNLPIFIQPTTKLAEGDLIKDACKW